MKQERSADRRKHHVIYKTTCLVTGRYYIGMHSTDDLADGYIGSGKRLWSSIKKHGAEQHVCKVLEHLPSRAALRLREAELVNEQLLEDKQCMNLALGGDGSWEHVNANRTSEQWLALHKAGHAGMTKSLTQEQVSDRASKGMKTTWARHRIIMCQAVTKGQQAATAAAASVEAQAKRRATMQTRGHSQGTKNPMYGKRWIHKDDAVKLILKDEVEPYLQQGWALGRTQRILSSVEEQSPTSGQTPTIENGRIHLDAA